MSGPIGAFPAPGEVLALPDCLLFPEGRAKPASSSSSSLPPPLCCYSHGAAAAAVHGGPVLLLGGESLPGQGNLSNVYISVRSLAAKEGHVQWGDGRAVNTHGVMNRRHLAVAAMGDGSIWGFGGETSNMEIASEPFRVTVDDEGINVTPVRATGAPGPDGGAVVDAVAALRRKAHCAAAMGPSRAVAVLFGGVTTSSSGSSPSLRTLSDIFLVRAGDKSGGEGVIVEAIPAPLGDAPSPRAHFSYCVLGSSNQYLLISGGMEIKENGQAVALDDAWLLDMTRRIPEMNRADADAAPAAAAAGKGKGGGKGAAAAVDDTGVKWTRLASKLPAPLFDHIAVGYKTKDDNYSILLMGGKCKAQNRPRYPVQLSVQLGASGLVRDTIEAPSSASSSQGQDQGGEGEAAVRRLPREAVMDRNDLCAATVTNGNGDISCYFIFCSPSRDGCDDGDAFCLSCDSEAEVCAHVGEAVRRSLQMQQQRRTRSTQKLTGAGDAADLSGGQASEGAEQLEEEGAVDIELPSGDRYRGQATDGTGSGDALDRVPNGMGEMWYADGSHYKGEWRDGFRSGRGVWRSSDGSKVYEGSFEADTFNGPGALTTSLPSGEVEVASGNFVDGLLEGQGRYTNEKLGHVFEGAFERGLRHGFGVLYSSAPDNGSGISSDMSRPAESPPQPQDSPRAVVATCPDSGRPVLYTGMWVHGKPQGQGILSFEVRDDNAPNNTKKISARYEGELLDGLPHGTGECFLANGAYFVGQWRRGLRNGFGTFKQPNGDAYEGKWIADKRCGKGKWTSFRGDVIEGTWDEDLPHGQGVHKEVDGGLFEGTFARGRYHGSGTFTAADGSVYVGEWRHGLRHGRGEWTGPARPSDGEIAYRGEWADGLRCGRGAARYVSGESFAGVFIDDKPKK